MYSARAVMVGVFVGMTPTVGIQIPLIILIWGISNKYLGWTFPLAVAISLSFISNPVTMLPLYFAFYNVGSFLLNKEMSYQNINQLLSFFDPSISSVIDLMTFLVQDVGATILVGSLPCAIIFGFGGYAMTRWMVPCIIKTVFVTDSKS